MTSFIEGIPGDGVQKRKAIHQTQVDLGPKLGLCSGFSPDDGTDMGLINTDDSILDLVSSSFIHGLLLVINRLDDPILTLQPVSERKNAEAIELFFNRFEVPSQVLKLGLDALPDGFSGWILVLGYLQVAFPGYSPIGSGLLPLGIFPMQFINDCFCDLPGFVQ